LSLPSGLIFRVNPQRERRYERNNLNKNLQEAIHDEKAGKMLNSDGNAV
jgi:hypothetical protein